MYKKTSIYIAACITLVVLMFSIITYQYFQAFGLGPIGAELEWEDLSLFSIVVGISNIFSVFLIGMWFCIIFITQDQNHEAHKTIVFLSLVFICIMIYGAWIPNYAIARVAGSLIEKMGFRHQFGTDYPLELQSCKLMKKSYPYASYYFFEDTKNETCIIRNAYEVYDSRAFRHVLLLPPNGGQGVILTIRKIPNTVEYAKEIEGNIIRKIMPNAMLPKVTPK